MNSHAPVLPLGFWTTLKDKKGSDGHAICLIPVIFFFMLLSLSALLVEGWKKTEQ